MQLLLFTALYAFAYASTPECRWLCDDPVCPAHCVPVCQAPRCQVHCTAPLTCTVQIPTCTTRCPPDQSPSDHCPACETVCQPTGCPSGCETLCEAPVCAWHCTKPAMCVQPRCELNCERPACEAAVASISPRVSAGKWTVLAGVVLVMLVL